MNCPNCNTEIEEGVLFCGECGTKIENKKTCKNCGAEMRAGAMFCPECGLAVEVAEEVAEPAESAETQTPAEENVVVPVAEVEQPQESAPAEAVIKSKADIEEELEKTMAIPIIRKTPINPVNVNPPVQPVRREAAPMPNPGMAQPAMPRPAAPQPAMNRPAAAQPVVPRPAMPQPVNTVPPAPPVADHNYGYRAASMAGGNVNPPMAYAKKEPVAKKEKHSSDKKESGQTQKNILIFLIVFLVVILIGLGAIFLIMNPGKEDGADNTAASSQQKDDQKDENASENQKTDEEDSDKGNKTKDAGSSGASKRYKLSVDFDYEFAREVELDEEAYGVESLGLVEEENEDFELTYCVPEYFSKDKSSKKEVRYVEEENTAYMKVVTMENKEKYTLEDVMNETLDTFTDFGVSIKGFDRKSFHVETEYDDIVYIQKCYVNNDYIRYFEFVYPYEYSHIYEDYFDELDSNFVCE